MQGPDHSSLLRRKLGVTPAPEFGKGAARPEVDAMRAAARAAYTAAGLKVEMRASAMELLNGLTDLIAAVESAMLIVPFTAPDGIEGYVALSNDFAQSLIEKATTGRLSNLPVEPRAASSIDMLLCRDFLVRFLETWREICEGKPTSEWLSGYAPQSEAVSGDIMELNSRDVPYTLFRIEMRLDDQRDAQLVTAFPTDRIPKHELRADTPADPEMDWGKVWRDAVMDTHAELDAVLVRLQIPLFEVKQWAPGDFVSIPPDVLGAVTLGRRGGAVVATARLGQAKGHRALRLNSVSKDGSSEVLPTDKETAASAEPALDKPEFKGKLPAQTPTATETPGPQAQSEAAAPEAGADPAEHDVLP